MDGKRESSTRLMQQLLDNGKLGPITPAMKRLQEKYLEKYLAGRMNGQDFQFSCDRRSPEACPRAGGAAEQLIVADFGSARFPCFPALCRRSPPPGFLWPLLGPLVAGSRLQGCFLWGLLGALSGPDSVPVCRETAPQNGL
jgi:hypothetical protein